ncbi:MAG: holo-ACP synthase [Candidatus Pacearchaeota archaeon]|jgi:holo-[acyl-carrier protein] synthase
MISNIGADIESINELKRSIKNKNFVNMIFSKREIDYCLSKKEPVLSFAGKFSAKESVIKALKQKIAIKDIEIINSPAGKPEVYIKGKKNKKILCTISHNQDYALAFVVINN